MKKVFALALVACVFAVSIGCGGATSASGTKGSSTTISSATTTTK